LKDKIDYIIDFINDNEDISNKISLNIDNLTSILDNYEEEFIKEYFYYKKIQRKITEEFNNIPEDIY